MKSLFDTDFGLTTPDGWKALMSILWGREDGTWSLLGKSTSRLLLAVTSLMVSGFLDLDTLSLFISELEVLLLLLGSLDRPCGGEDESDGDSKGDNCSGGRLSRGT